MSYSQYGGSFISPLKQHSFFNDKGYFITSLRLGNRKHPYHHAFHRVFSMIDVDGIEHDVYDLNLASSQGGFSMINPANSGGLGNFNSLTEFDRSKDADWKKNLYKALVFINDSVVMDLKKSIKELNKIEKGSELYDLFIRQAIAEHGTLSQAVKPFVEESLNKASKSFTCGASGSFGHRDATMG